MTNRLHVLDALPPHPERTRARNAIKYNHARARMARPRTAALTRSRVAELLAENARARAHVRDSQRNRQPPHIGAGIYLSLAAAARELGVAYTELRQAAERGELTVCAVAPKRDPVVLVHLPILRRWVNRRLWAAAREAERIG